MSTNDCRSHNYITIANLRYVEIALREKRKKGLSRVL